MFFAMTRVAVESRYFRRLRAVSLLSGASPGELRAVAQVAEIMRVPAGTALVSPGRSWEGVYVVASGSLSFVTANGADVAVAGTSVFVGDDVGTSVVAMTESTIVAIAVREWRALRALAPGVVQAVERRTMVPPVVEPQEIPLPVRAATCDIVR
jgi:CRP-like cAMP-binding protein